MRNTSPLHLASAALLALSLHGCQGSDGRRAPASPLEPSAGTVVVPSTGQATLGDLRIGAGNVWDEEYADDAGRWQTGPTAGLWFYFDAARATGVHRRVHAGESFVVAGHRVDVVAVETESVTLRLSPSAT